MKKFIKDLKDSWKGLPKIIGIVVLVFIILFILIGGYIWFRDFQQSQEINRVEVNVSYNLEKCSDEFPLLFIVFNKSNKTVDSITAYIKITKKGHSTDIGDYTRYYFDKIIGSQKGYTRCAKYVLSEGFEKYNEPDNLVFEIKDKYIDFQE